MKIYVVDVVFTIESLQEELLLSFKDMGKEESLTLVAPPHM